MNLERFWLQVVIEFYKHNQDVSTLLLEICGILLDGESSGYPGSTHTNRCGLPEILKLPVVSFFSEARVSQ